LQTVRLRLRPSAVAVDGNNNIMVVDKCNNRIRMIASKGVRVTTLAGSAEMGKRRRHRRLCSIRLAKHDVGRAGAPAGP